MELRSRRYDLRINREPHLVANDDAPGFEQLVPAQTKILAIELSGCAEPGTIVPIWILGDALERHVERDFLRDAVQREIADQAVLVRVARRALDASASEGHRWILVDFEEVGRFQMRVPLRLTCIDARDANRRLELSA